IDLLRAVLRRFAGEIDLHEQVDLTSGRGGRGVDLRDEIGRVDRMNDVEASGLLRFVRLQVSDQMPADREITCLLDLLQRLLHFVLAEIDLAGDCRGADGVGRKGLGDGDEADGGGIASGPAGRALDASADAGQPGLERGRIDHYFFGNDPRMPFAVAAFGPVGASFRYVSNSAA